MKAHRPLRKQMATVMLALAIIPLVILVAGVIVQVNSLVNQNKRDLQSITYRTVSIVREGFMQNESFIYRLYLQWGIDTRPGGKDLTPDEILEHVYDNMTEKTGGAPIPSYIFIVQDGHLIAAKGYDAIEPDILEQMVCDMVDPLLPELFAYEGAGEYQTVTEIFREDDWGMMYPSAHGEESFLLSWCPMTDDMRVGCFMTGAISEMQVDLLYDLVDMAQEDAEGRIRTILVHGIIALGIMLLVLVGAILYFSRRLSARVSTPVERRAQEQDELLRRAEEEKAVLESLSRMKTEFLSNVSHELKTPLTVITSHMQVGQQKLAEKPDIQELEQRMQLVSGEAERMALMVGQLLDVGRIDEGRMLLEQRRESILEIIQATLNTYYPVFTKNGNELRFLPERDIHPVSCDRMRVMQVLVNLISNASKYTFGGVITVSVSTQGDFAQVSVADTGRGIPPERIPTLFQRYSGQRSLDIRQDVYETGTGLGLYICKHIIAAHGGDIRIESDLGKGTAVSFTLPFDSEGLSAGEP